MPPGSLQLSRMPRAEQAADETSRSKTFSETPTLEGNMPNIFPLFTSGIHILYRHALLRAESNSFPAQIGCLQSSLLLSYAPNALELSIRPISIAFAK